LNQLLGAGVEGQKGGREDARLQQADHTHDQAAGKILFYSNIQIFKHDGSSIQILNIRVSRV
jgi:hypothetical protein